MCSVLFLDISEYSKKQVAEQITLKEAFNSYLARAIRDIPVNDRIILDTGDGAAISFLGDVSDALKVTLSLRESFFQEGVLLMPPLLVRMGINLGPVRLVRDINGQPNIVGDGINVAQRIMGFADTGQVLVSRSYYDAVSRLSKEYAGMFHYQGSRTDKHVREHEVYAIGYPGELAGSQVRVADNLLQAAFRLFQNAPHVQRMLYIGLPVAVFFLLAVVFYKALHRSVPVLPPVAIAPYQPASAVEASAPVEAMPMKDEPGAVADSSAGGTGPEKKIGVAAVPKAKPEVAVKPEMKAKLEAAVATNKGQAISGATEKKQKAALSEQILPKHASVSSVPIATVRTLEETTAVEPKSEAIVSLAVTPWGEVYLDGRMQGVSPPLMELHVLPGKHEIEFRNTTFPAYIEKVQLKAGEKIKIKYKFTN